MNIFAAVVQLIRKILFQKKYKRLEPEPLISEKELDAERKNPYFVQIGFDFGTSYSKCIWRDVMVNKAFVHICSISEEYELPFLIPSALVLKNGCLFLVENPGIHYPENGLYHLKNALVSVALKQWDDPVLIPFRNGLGQNGNEQLSEFVESCAVYFLSCAFGDIKKRLLEKMSDFGTLASDYMAINMAVPVADAQRLAVNNLYQKILCEAWSLADKFAGNSSIKILELNAIRGENQVHADRNSDSACFIYPEVSANVQGFVRSRASSPGTYLFSDTGGNSVDQSVFIFMRDSKRGDFLTYLAAQVHPFGSGQIEQIAAECANNTDCYNLEYWRKKKERREISPELRIALDKICDKLKKGTESTLHLAKSKLIRKEQLIDIRVIFTGGGHCDYPYKYATMHPFSGRLFPRPIDPDVIGLPIPIDLELAEHEKRWMSRLYVAYGLSFERNNLSNFIYPKDVPNPEPEEIWKPREISVEFPSKDVT